MARSSRTTKKRAGFLAALETTGNVTLACEMARLPRRSAYDWRADDPEFAADWEKSLDLGIDALEDEANRRAREGRSSCGRA